MLMVKLKDGGSSSDNCLMRFANWNKWWEGFKRYNHCLAGFPASACIYLHDIVTHWIFNKRAKEITRCNISMNWSILMTVGNARYPWILVHLSCVLSLMARFMGPMWGPSGAGRTQVGPILAPWTSPSGILLVSLWGYKRNRVVCDA